MGINYDLLIRKIDEFIRKYYTNQLIRGLLYSAAVLGSYMVLVILLEYFSWFSTSVRGGLFYTFLGVAGFILIRFILIPLSRIRKLGKVISHEQAADIIGRHFSEVKDTLLNTLQLHRLSESSDQSSELVLASIDQKIRKLQPVIFADAVDLKKNRKFLPYALPPVVFLLAMLMISPSFILAPTRRIIHHNEVFERPAPFHVKILNENLQAVQQDDFTVKVKLEGDEIPAVLFIRSGQASYRMEKESNVLYSFTFRNLQNNTPFIITAEQYNSKEYTIRILPKPVILSFDVEADYPVYTGKKNEVLSNTGDLTVPAGTRLTWKFYTRDTRNILFRLGDKVENLTSGNSNTFVKTSRMLSGAPYSVVIGNEYFNRRDSLAYLINVIPDLYPSITADEYRDSVYDNRLYFQGTVKDDYGLRDLRFVSIVKKKGEDTPSADPKSLEISLDKSLLQQPFYYFLDMSSLQLEPGDELTYYFEIWDNDGITGSKSTRSNTKMYKVPTLEEIAAKTDKKDEEIKDKMESVIRQSKLLQKQVEDMQKKLVDKKEIGWQEKQSLQQMLNKQQSLQNEVREIQKENLEKGRMEQQYKELSPELLEKQNQLEELFNKVMSEDLKKTYEELQKMLENVDKDKVAEMLDKMKDDSKSVEKELDRNLELFKQLEVEKKLQESIDKLNQIAEDQEKLSEKTKNSTGEELNKRKDEQQELNRQFDQLKEDVQEMMKKNSELEEPNSLKDTENDQKDIEQDMDQSSEELNQGKPQNASKSQKSASGKMKKLSQQMMEMQAQMESESDGEDMEAMRQILDNLVKISFGQEAIMKDLDVIRTTNPKYLEVIQKQKNLKDDLKVVSDSLYAVSKRQASIEPFILRELTSVENNMDEAMTQLNSRSVAPARAKQQYAMTSVNNLALMLSESLKKMQQNMQAGGSGKSSAKCNKPKGGEGKMKSMRQLQEQMNKQLKEMKEGMNPGKPGSSGQKQMSEKLARMAAQQEALRRQLQQYGEELQKETGGTDKNLKEMMQQMEQTETDLVNKRISSETIRRQQDIVTRMLESEKAEQQRELDQKRESKEPKDNFYNNPAKFFEYNKLKNKETELIRVVPPGLKPFYKGKVNAYFLSFE
jgi:hypothetical protein